LKVALTLVPLQTLAVLGVLANKVGAVGCALTVTKGVPINPADKQPLASVTLVKL